MSISICPHTYTYSNVFVFGRLRRFLDVFGVFFVFCFSLFVFMFLYVFGDFWMSWEAFLFLGSFLFWKFLDAFGCSWMSSEVFLFIVFLFLSFRRLLDAFNVFNVV